MFQGSGKVPGEGDVGVQTKRRDRLLVLGILLGLAPVILLGPLVLAPALDRANGVDGAVPGDRVATGERSDGRGGAAVSSAGWHQAIELGFGPVGPVPGTGLSRDGGGQGGAP